MDRAVIVSGGSRGLGSGLVEALLHAGCAVATFSRGGSEFIEGLRRDPRWQGRFLHETLDVLDSVALHAFVGRVEKEFGRIDVLVNNAAIARDGVLATVGDDVIDEVVDVNLKAALRLTRSCVRRMLPRRQGRIISISSIIGLSGYRGLAVYSATKAGLDAMTRSLARELGSRGVLVNSIAPGYLRTEMSHGLSEEQLGQIAHRTPLGRLGEIGDVVPLLLFLCSDQSNFITGQTIVVDGGLTA